MARPEPLFGGRAARKHLDAMVFSVQTLVRDKLWTTEPNASSEIRSREEAVNDQITLLKAQLRKNIDYAERHGSAEAIEYVHFASTMLRVLEAL